MGMDYFLATIRADICDETPTTCGDALLRGELSCNVRDAAQRGGLCVTHLPQIREVLVGNDQHVNRGLRRDVPESCHQFILIELLRRDLS